MIGRLICLVGIPGFTLLASCANYKGVYAEPSPTPGKRVNWPGTPFKEVRAYCYDYTAESSPSFFVEGRMHKGVMDPRGVPLSDAQVRWLIDAVSVSQARQDRTACYKPHHAFVFYGESRRVVAVFEMCFGCNKFVATPSGVPEYVDYARLYSLAKALGLPLGRGNEFYREACLRGRPLP